MNLFSFAVVFLLVRVARSQDETSSALTRTDYIAIGVSLGLTLTILGFMLFFLRRRIVEQQEPRAERSARSIETHSNPVAEPEENEFTTAL